MQMRKEWQLWVCFCTVGYEASSFELVARQNHGRPQGSQDRAESRRGLDPLKPTN